MTNLDLAKTKFTSELHAKLASVVPHGGPEMVADAIAAIVILLIAVAVYLLVRRSLAALQESGRLSRRTNAIMRRISYWAILLFAGLLSLQQFGMMENAWATLTAMIAMVAIGFVAVWSVLSNTFCSIILMMSRPFDVGDTIEIHGDGLRGKVIDFNLIYTTLRGDDRALLQVPNNLFFQNTIRREIGDATITLDQQADRAEPME